MLENLFSMEGPYARFMNWLWNILVLSVLWLVCSLPVITLGASSTAAYYAASKVIRRKTGRIHQEFYSSFRRNLHQSLVLTVVWILLLLVIGVECLYLYSDPQIPIPVLYLFDAMLLVVLAWGTYLWACLSRFDQSSFALFRMSVVLTFRHLPTTILLLALFILVLLGVYFMPWGILLFPGCGYFLSTYPVEKILLKYSPVVSQDDPEAQKWYYQ